MQTNAQKHTFNDSNSLFQAFHDNGYLTAMFGKLTNDMTKYFCQYNPPITKGIDRIQAPCDYNDFYGSQLRGVIIFVFILVVYIFTLSEKIRLDGCWCSVCVL